MAKYWAVAVALLAGCALFLGTRTTTAAPAPPATKTVEKWEYCEILTSGRAAVIRPIGGAVQPAQPAQPVQQGQPSSVKFNSGTEEFDATSWEDLGNKLKAPELKKDASANAHKMRVLNFMGDQGWEMVSSQQTPTSGVGSWTFKRKSTKEVKEAKEAKDK